MKKIILQAVMLIGIALHTNQIYAQYVVQNGLSVDTASCIYNMQLGNDVGQTKAKLLSTREVPMNGHNIMFNDDSTMASIGVGHPLGTSGTTLAKFEVSNNARDTCGAFFTEIASPTNFVVGVYGTSLNTDDGGSCAILGVSLGSGLPSSTIYNAAAGVVGASLTASYLNIGVGGYAANATFQSIAADFDVKDSNSPENYGIQTEVTGGSNAASVNYGYNIIVSNSGTDNYGIFSSVDGATTNWAGYFDGDVYISGSYGPSDIKLKENVAPLVNAMDVINKLNPKTYLYKQKDFPTMHLPSGQQYGLIAQEVKEVLPGLTKKSLQPPIRDKKGKIEHEAVEFMAINYTELIPILLSGIKEQQATIGELEKKVAVQDASIAAMQAQMDKLAEQMTDKRKTGNDVTAVTITDITIGDGQSVILDDNVPNPFNEQTTISYFLPDNVGRAQMMFYNLEGKQIKTVQLEGKGKGQLNVFASDLSGGVYTYTLVVDGKIIQTKRMVKQ